MNAIESINSTLKNMTKYISPVKRSTFKNVINSLEEKIEHLGHVINKLKERIENLELERKVFIAIVIIIIILIVLYIIWEKIRPKEKLWGRLINIKNKKEKYNLSEIRSGDKLKFSISGESDTANFELSLSVVHGKKVINMKPLSKGWNVEFLNQENQPIRANFYLDDEVHTIKIFKKNDHEMLYKYCFLKAFEDSLKPVYGKEFKGRYQEIKKIRDNFLQKERRNNIIIDGLGNFGKTSLITHLYEEVFKENELLNKYTTCLLLYNGDTNNFGDNFKEIEKQINSSDKSSKKDRIIFIDNFDEIYEKFKGKFETFIKSTINRGNCFFVFAGRSNFELLKKKNVIILKPENIESIPLYGLDDSKETSNNGSNSLQLINFLLKDIGFPNDIFKNDSLNNIAKYSKGNPFIIKQKLKTHIENWLLDKSKKGNIETTGETGIPHEHLPIKDYTIGRAVNFYKGDELYKNDDIRHIFNAMKSTETSELDRMKQNDIFDHIKSRAWSKIETVDKKKSFEEQLNTLNEMRLINMNNDGISLTLPKDLYECELPTVGNS